ILDDLQQPTKPISVSGNEVTVDGVRFEQNIEHAVEQRDVRTRSYRQGEGGKVRGLRPAGGDGDGHKLVRICQLPPPDAPEDYRMTVGRVRTDEKKAIGNIDICVAGRRSV